MQEPNFSSPHILIVDDDTRIRDLLSKFLKENQFLVSGVGTTKEAFDITKLVLVDLMILDVMLPDGSGVDFARRSDRPKDIPILMLTALGEMDDRIRGLESGIDDYMTKPFEPRELLLRLQMILRRTFQKKQKQYYNFGPYQFDLVTETLTKGSAIIFLTSTETTLLKIFIEHRGKTLSRDDIVALSGNTIGERSVDVQINRLRKKIENDPKQPYYVQTVRGAGYMMVSHG